METAATGAIASLFDPSLSRASCRLVITYLGTVSKSYSY